MPNISPGWKTDLDIVVMGGSEVVRFDDHLVVRTPNKKWIAIENNASRQRMCADGSAAWFGAFFGGELVASLGIVKCGTDGRYRAVEAEETQRRKVRASHLLGLAASWPKENGCEKWVIVTEAANAAGRLYRRAGFSPDVSVVSAYRKAA